MTLRSGDEAPALPVARRPALAARQPSTLRTPAPCPLPCV